jgi:hypothetical protein
MIFNGRNSLVECSNSVSPPPPRELSCEDLTVLISLGGGEFTMWFNYNVIIIIIIIIICETWSLTLRDKHRLGVFENRVLRRIFGLQRDKVTGGWRKLHEELHNLYSSPNIIRMIEPRRMRWAGHVARMGKKRNAYSILVGKPEGKRPLGRPRRRWVDNIKIDLREIGWDRSGPG